MHGGPHGELHDRPVAACVEAPGGATMESKPRRCAPCCSQLWHVPAPHQPPGLPHDEGHAPMRGGLHEDLQDHPGADSVPEPGEVTKENKPRRCASCCSLLGMCLPSPSHPPCPTIRIVPECMDVCMKSSRFAQVPSLCKRRAGPPKTACLGVRALLLPALACARPAPATRHPPRWGPCNRAWRCMKNSRIALVPTPCKSRAGPQRTASVGVSRLRPQAAAAAPKSRGSAAAAAPKSPFPFLPKPSPSPSLSQLLPSPIPSPFPVAPTACASTKQRGVFGGRRLPVFLQREDCQGDGVINVL